MCSGSPLYTEPDANPSSQRGRSRSAIVSISRRMSPRSSALLGEAVVRRELAPIRLDRLLDARRTVVTHVSPSFPQPRVDALGLLVDRAELAVQLVVGRAVSRIGLERLDDVERCGAMSSSVIRPSASAASSAAPRALARIGCSTWRIGRSSTSAMIWHQSGDCAPPPMKLSHGKRLAGELLDVAEQPAAVEGDAFEHRPHEVGARRLRSDRLCQPPRSVVVVDRACARRSATA